jgi:hypothetical protein
MGAVPPPVPSTLASNCAAESCDGELTQQGIAELRATAAQTEQCYEAELRAYERDKLDHQQLQGHVLLRLRLAAGQTLCSVEVERADFKPSERFANCIFAKMREATVRPISGCIDVALPLAFVCKEVENLPDGGASPSSPQK